MDNESSLETQLLCCHCNVSYHFNQLLDKNILTIEKINQYFNQCFDHYVELMETILIDKKGSKKREKLQYLTNEVGAILRAETKTGFTHLKDFYLGQNRFNELVIKEENYSFIIEYIDAIDINIRGQIYHLEKGNNKNPIKNEKYKLKQITLLLGELQRKGFFVSSKTKIAHSLINVIGYSDDQFLRSNLSLGSSIEGLNISDVEVIVELLDSVSKELMKYKKDLI